MAGKTQYTIFYTNDNGNTSNVVRKTEKGKDAFLNKLHAEGRQNITIEEMHYDEEGTTVYNFRVRELK